MLLLYKKLQEYRIYLLCHFQDSVVMERLIEKYMLLPNQAWDNIVKEATRVSNSCLLSVLHQGYIFSVIIFERIWFSFKTLIIVLQLTPDNLNPY